MTKYQDKKLKAELHLMRRRCEGEKCQRCGKQVYLQLSHIKGQGAWPRLKYTPENSILLCNSCHLFWWHRDVTEASEWFKKTFPTRWKKLNNMVKDYYTLPRPDFKKCMVEIKGIDKMAK